MNEERRQILDMLASGKISADEAERLLDALGRDKTEPAAESARATGEGREKPKYLRVQVTPKERDGDTVNIRVPLLLVRTGLKLKGLLPDKTRTKVDQALESKGIHLNLDELDGEGLEAIIGALSESKIEVDDHKEQVRIFCE